MDQIVLKTVCINGTNVPYEGLPSGRGIKSANEGWGFDSPTGYKPGYCIRFRRFGAVNPCGEYIMVDGMCCAY